MLALAAKFCACSEKGNEADEQEKPNPQNKVLVGTKWTSQNWDYDFDDDGEWAYYYNEIYIVYFYSQSEGVTYYDRKTVDSDNGNSHIRYACFFKYNVTGNAVDIEPITDPFKEFQYYYTLGKDELKYKDFALSKGIINNDDRKWLSTITGATGDCSWYYNYFSGLTIAGEGKMSDYKSYEATPWNYKYHAINQVKVLDGVKYVGAFAFASPSIGTVKLPYYGDLEGIGEHAFENSCIGEISLGNDVKYVGKEAFANCKYASIIFSEGIEEIGDDACWRCKSASLLKTPNLRKVGNDAFGGGCELKYWTDSEILEYVGRGAFGDIKNCKEIYLPAIKELGHCAFTCKNIQKIHVGQDLQKVTGTPFFCASSGTLTIDVKSPLKLEYDFVDNNYVKKWDLTVPAGSEASYRSTPYWKNFKSINGGSGTGAESGTIMVFTQSSVTAHAFSAILYGEVQGVGENVEVGFLYGETGDLKTSGRTVGTISDGSFALEIDKLLDNTKYYYCAYARIDGKYYYGDVCSFRTEEADSPSNLKYTIDGKEYRMILVEGAPDGDFYMMQTELPPSSSIRIGSELIDKPDRNFDGAIIKAEMRNFLDDIRKQTGIAFRLPSKKEWLYAASGGNYSSGCRYSGSNNIDDVAWYIANSQKKPHDIALKTANELGLYDMSGNYSEVTNDTEDIYYVDGYICGGSWNDTAANCTATSNKAGSQSGNLPGMTIREKNAFDARYSTIRLVYSKK